MALWAYMKKYMPVLFMFILIFTLLGFSFNSASAETLTQNLQIVSRGSDVSILQKFLKAEGYFFGIVDGRYGRITARAVGDFQEDVGLPRTEIVDAVTRAKINATIAGGLKEFDTTNLPVGCTSTLGYSPTTGVKCDTVTNTNFPPGCTSTSGFSTTTGLPCSGTTSFPPGCTSDQGYSSTTGEPCGVTVPFCPPTYVGGPQYVCPPTNMPIISNVAGKAAGNLEIDAGGSVGIMGSNFIGEKTTQVYIGGMSCTITQLGNELIYCTAPTNLTVGGFYNLYLVNTKGQSNTVKVKVISTVTSTQPSLSAYLSDALSDRAGIWDKFGPGVGNGNPTKYDWHWSANLYIPSANKIKSITMAHSSNGEGWSTSASDAQFGVKPYPLVVYAGTSMLNVDANYNENIVGKVGEFSSGSYEFPTGSYTLDLYGQIETGHFSGGRLTVAFTDSTSVTAKVPSSNINPTSCLSGFSSTTGEPCN